MTNIIEIGGKPVGGDAPFFVIAEAGVNHNWDVDLAHQLIDAAADAGADAVKFQAFISENLVTRDAPKATYQHQTTSEDDTHFRMLKSLELSAEVHGVLASHCVDRQLGYMCTPYDAESAAMLDRLDISAFKISSTDVTNVPLLAHIGRYGRPAILSTGMATLAEVDEAVTALALPAQRLALLHCTSEYPAPPEQSNLRAMETLNTAFAVPVGFSDHTAGLGMAPYAVAFGAKLIEKHFTLDRAMEGPDHQASVEPRELQKMIDTIRTVERALGDGIKKPAKSEIENRRVVRRSLVAARPIQRGEQILAADLITKRPGTGLRPSTIDLIIGSYARVDISADQQIQLSMLRFDRGNAE